MVNGIILIAFILYFGYNILQVKAAMDGTRPENMFFLFFLAAPVDLYYYVKAKS